MLGVAAAARGGVALGWGTRSGGLRARPKILTGSRLLGEPRVGGLGFKASCPRLVNRRGGGGRRRENNPKTFKKAQKAAWRVRAAPDQSAGPVCLLCFLVVCL